MKQKNLDLASDMANTLQKFDEFKQKFLFTPPPIYHKTRNLYKRKKKRKELINYNQNLFVQIPIKRILRRNSSVDIEIKKIMAPLIKYSDSLYFCLAEYIINDSIILSIKTNKVSYHNINNYEENIINNIIANNVINKEQNAR